MSEVFKKNWYLYLPMLGCVVSFVLFLCVAFQRIDYPYQIEWIEGGVLQQVIQVAEGRQLYAAPDSDYAPALYMPFYYYLSAFVGSFSGDYFFGMRLVSIVASLITALSCGVSVSLLLRNKSAGFLGFLSYFVPYRFTGYWYDVGRVDSLWTMWLSLMILSLILAFYCRRNWWLGIGVLLFVCALLTKQSSIFLLPFLFFAVCAWFGIRVAVWLSVSTAMMLILMGLLLAVLLGDLFFYITFEMSVAHDFNWHRIDMFLLENTLLKMPTFFIFSLFFLVDIRRSRREWSGWFFIFLGFSSVSAISRMYAGGVSNVLMPYYAIIILMGCVGFCRFCSVYQGRAVIVLPVALLFVLNACGGWFAVQQQIPSEKDRAAGDALVERLRHTSGRVCLTKDGYLGYLAGKNFCAHNAFLADLMNGSNQQLAENLAAGINERLRNGYYQLVVFNNAVEVTGYGLSLNQLPYTANLIDYGDDKSNPSVFFPVAGGPRPGSWLVFNGDSWRDRR